MNVEKKEFFNPEKEITELYEKETLIEKAKVNDIDDLIVVHYYWKDSDGDLWNNFDDPMENVRSDFNAYRSRVGFMQPWELKKLREDIKMTVREFGNWTGIGYGNISKIENNQRVQTKYQDRIFKLTKDKFDATGCISDESNIEIYSEDFFYPNLLLDEKEDYFISTYSYNDNLGDAI